MVKIFLTIVVLVLVPTAASADVSFDGTEVHVDGTPINQGSSAEGLVMNSRMVMAAIEDYGSAQNVWAYPNGPWSAQRNLNEFIEQLPTYASYGLNMVTVGMMGGHPRFQCGDTGRIGRRNFSMFDSSGDLRADARDRLTQVITAADANGLLVNVQYFYRTADLHLNSSTVLNAVDQATTFLRDLNVGNVFVEVANEVNAKNYDVPELKPDQIDDRIAQIKSIWPEALVSVSMSGGKLYPANISAAVDWSSVHGNGLSVSNTTLRTNQLRALNKPVIFTEDYWDGGTTMNAAVSAGAGWGFYEQGCEFEGNYNGSARYRDGFQSLPVNWSLSNPTKLAFFERVAQLT